MNPDEIVMWVVYDTDNRRVQGIFQRYRDANNWNRGCYSIARLPLSYLQAGKDCAVVPLTERDEKD